MVRPLRIEYENAFYHVMNRGRGRQQIFHDKSYYEAFLEVLAQAHQRFHIEIYAYCLMGNHYHLLVKTPLGNLSRAMRHINGVYTQRHNQLKKTDGPVFRGRYKSILIEASSYLLNLSRYIHRNPIETSKPLVTQLPRYRWSSYPAYLGRQEAPDWLVLKAVYGELGSHEPERYRRFVNAGLDEDYGRFHQKQQWPQILGSEEFAEAAFANALSHDKEIEKGSLKEWVPLNRVISRVASHFGQSRKQLITGKRGRAGKNIARQIAMKLGQELSGQTLESLAKVFHVTHYSSISRHISQVNEQLKRDEGLRKAVNSITQDLTPYPKVI